jgi:uncharacterized damage-inducible protein DinB
VATNHQGNPRLNSRVTPFANLLRLNARLLANCLDHVTEDQARARVLSSVNSMAFLIAHLTDARHSLLTLLGGSAENPLASLLESATSMDDVAVLPSLADLLSAWWAVDQALASRLADLADADLDAMSPQRYPGGDASVLGALAFLVQHDSYHVGQLALLRRAHGLPAMRYSQPPARAT